MSLRTSSAIPGEASPGLLIPGSPGPPPVAFGLSAATGRILTMATPGGRP